MKKLLIIPVLLLSLFCSAATYYISPDGNDSNAGTITSPWKSWNKGFNTVVAGDILYIRGGTYTTMLGSSGSNYFGVRLDSKNGTASSHITISAYNNEVPVLDGSSLTSSSGQNIGIALYNCSYIDLIGLNILNFTAHATNANDAPGFYESNVSNITHTLCTVRHCGDGFTLWGSHNNIYYTNCDSYENADTFADPSGALPGSLANGFYCSPDSGAHIYYIGCRAWNCSDDGWDFFGGDGYIELTNCWAFNNGWTDAGGPIQYTKGDGSGFKLGPTNTLESGFQRTVKDCVAAGNLGPGFDINKGSYTNVRHALYNCVAANNTAEGFQYYGDALSTVRNSIAFGNSNNPGAVSTFATSDHNSWQNGLVISAADFASTNIAELKSPRKADGSLPDVNFMHLVAGSKLIDAGVDVGIAYSGNAPDLGSFEQTGSAPVPVPAPVPAFVSSSVENATPNLLSMTYSLALANIVPLASSFNVMVNTVARNVNAVTVSGTKVLLTLTSPVINGDAIRVTYTKPATNPIQTSLGGQAATLSNQTVTNNVSSVIVPAYVSSAIEDATPKSLEMTFSLSLANIVPATTSFSVLVNSVSRIVNTVAISGTKIVLSLASPVVNGDIVTVAYNKPVTSPVQIASGGQAASISAKSVTNKTLSIAKDATPVTITMTITPNHIHNIINVQYVYSSSFSSLNAALSPQIIRIFDKYGKLLTEKLLVTGVAKYVIPINYRRGIYTVLTLSGGVQMASQKIIVY